MFGGMQILYNLYERHSPIDVHFLNIHPLLSRYVIKLYFWDHPCELYLIENQRLDFFIYKRPNESFVSKIFMY